MTENVSPVKVPLLSITAALVTGLLWIYAPLLALDPVLARDDAHLLDIVRTYGVHVSHFTDLFIYQPVRNLSVMLDLAVGTWLGHGVLHFTNVMIWLAILALIYRITLLLHPNRQRAIVIGIALLAFHPLAVSSVAWISARKHLLAFLFILLATLQYVKARAQPSLKHFAIIFLCYVLSIFSHPILVLWPLWVAVDLLIEQRRFLSDRRLILAGIAFIVVFLAAILLNLDYYSSLYTQHVGAVKLSGEYAPGIAMLALGRYVFNALLPIRISATYYPGSAANVIGLVLMAGLLAGVYFSVRRKQCASWVALFFFSLAPVTVVMTNVFVSDTYELLPLFALFQLAMVQTDSRPRLTKLWWVPLTFLPVFMALSYQQARTWISDRNIWEHAWATEPSPRSLQIRAGYLLGDKKYAEAREAALQLREWSPAHRADADYLLAAATYFDSRIDLSTRMQQIESLDSTDPWIAYYRAALSAEAGDFSKAYFKMKTAIASPHAFGAHIATIAAEVEIICKKAKRADCSKTSEDLRKLCSGSRPRSCSWMEDLYQKRLATIGRS